MSVCVLARHKNQGGRKGLKKQKTMEGEREGRKDGVAPCAGRHEEMCVNLMQEGKESESCITLSTLRRTEPILL